MAEYCDLSSRFSIVQTIPYPLDIHPSITDDPMSAAIASPPAASTPCRTIVDVFPVHICCLQSRFQFIGCGLEAWRSSDGVDDGASVDRFRHEEENTVAGYLGL